MPTGVLAAQEAGFVGAGVTIGILDSGADTSLSPLSGDEKISWYMSSEDPTLAAPGDDLGHGSVMAMLAAGTKTDDYVGGVAPGATLAIGRILDKNEGTHEYASIYRAMIANGVKLFSLSWGTSIADMPINDFTLNDFDSLYGQMVNAGDLIVFAGGNSGPNNLDFQAAAPSYLPDLQKGWIAAVNLDIGITGAFVGDDGKAYINYSGAITGLEPSSAACGVAAWWCVGAPGFAQTLPIPGTSFTTGQTGGTSDSTAIISGVSALVWGAFPWMSGTDVQQTVLTTATYLPDGSSNDTTKTPNATTGWGLVNAAKAVYGPAQFAFGEFDADVGDYTSTFANAISGSGSLALSGNTGTLNLAADNTYTGGTVVNSGTLKLTGSLASDVIVNGGMFGGNGTVHASVQNVGGAVFSSASAPGTGLSIDGNYTAAAASSTFINFGNPMQVAGSATLDGSLVLSAPNDYTSGGTEELLHAGGKVAGTFAKTDTTGLAFYDATVNYSAQDVTATTSRKATAQAASVTLQSSPVLVSASKGVDNALNLADQWSKTDYAGHQTFLDSAAKLLSAPTTALAAASVGSLGGEIHGTLGAIEAATSNQVDHVVSVRQNAVRNGDGVAAWAQTFTGNNGLSQAGYASARTTGNGGLVGVDVPVSGNLTLGVFGGKNRSTSALAALAGWANERDTLGGIYGKYQFDEGAYVAGRASWTHADLDVSRTALLGTSLESLHTTRTDGVGRLTLEAGKSFGDFTPYAAITALRINQAGFAEQGAGGFGLASASHRQSATLTDLGLRWNKGFAWIGGQSVFTGYTAWKHVLNGQSLDFTASLAGTPGAAFDVTGQSLVKNGWEAGASLSTKINKDWDWFIDVNTQGAPNRFHAFGANAGLRFTF